MIAAGESFLFPSQKYNCNDVWWSRTCSLSLQSPYHSSLSLLFAIFSCCLYPLLPLLGANRCCFFLSLTAWSRGKKRFSLILDRLSFILSISDRLLCGSFFAILLVPDGPARGLLSHCSLESSDRRHTRDKEKQMVHMGIETGSPSNCINWRTTSAKLNAKTREGIFASLERGIWLLTNLWEAKQKKYWQSSEQFWWIKQQ